MYRKDVLPARGHYLCMRQREEETKTGTGLILPRAQKRRGMDDDSNVPVLGLIVAVGASVVESGDTITAEYAAGDVILFREYAAQRLDLDGQQYALVPFGMACGLVREVAAQELDPEPSATPEE